jgi:hypothetical protein
LDLIVGVPIIQKLKGYILLPWFNNFLSLSAMNKGKVNAIAVTNDPKINSHQYFIFNLLLSKKIKTLAAVATTNKSVVADKTAGVLDQSAKKFLLCVMAKKLKYQVPTKPARASKR